MNQVKFFEVFIPQILLGPFLNTLPHTWWEIFAMWKLFILFLCPTRDFDSCSTWIWLRKHFTFIREQPIFRIGYTNGNKKAGLSPTLEGVQYLSILVFLWYDGKIWKFGPIREIFHGCIQYPVKLLRWSIFRK